MLLMAWKFIDIYPTLTDLAGIDSPDQLSDLVWCLYLKMEVYQQSAVFPRYHSAEAIKTDQFTLTQWYNKRGDLFVRCFMTT